MRPKRLSLPVRMKPFSMVLTQLRGTASVDERVLLVSLLFVLLLSLSLFSLPLVYRRASKVLKVESNISP